MKNPSRTKVGPGRTSWNETHIKNLNAPKVEQVSHRKFRKQSAESKVGLKNKNVSLIDSYFADKRKLK